MVHIGLEATLVFDAALGVILGSLTGILPGVKIPLIDELAVIVVESASALDLSVGESALEEQASELRGVVQPHLAGIIHCFAAVYPHRLCEKQANKPGIEKFDA